jgi:hypothetical protein
LSATPLELLANTAMLDEPVWLPPKLTNPKSANFTPVASPVTCSAYPVVLGATTARLLALYVHVDAEQSSPP